MGRNRFVHPDTIRLSLSDGDFIDIKKRLNTGEQRHVFARMARDITPGEKVTLDPEQVGFARVLEYLIGWSFTDEDGKPVPYSIDLPMAERESIVGNLDPESYREISDAIEAHEEKEEAARSAEKNALAALTS